jgi:hypothetical protein
MELDQSPRRSAEAAGVLIALGENSHRRKIARRHSRRHSTKIDHDRKHRRKGRIAEQDRHVVASDFALSSFKLAMLRYFHCLISNLFAAVSRQT